MKNKYFGTKIGCYIIYNYIETVVKGDVIENNSQSAINLKK
jgi:hypothetical protein